MAAKILNFKKALEEIYEECIGCGNLTNIRKDIPIDERNIPFQKGMGQICYNCYKKIQTEEKFKCRKMFS
jgi:hypothetical protein